MAMEEMENEEWVRGGENEVARSMGTESRCSIVPPTETVVGCGGRSGRSGHLNLKPPRLHRASRHPSRHLSAVALQTLSAAH